MPSFSRRSRDLELIDLPQPPDEWEEALRYIKVVNRWLGGTRAVLWHFRRWSRRWKPGERIVVLDAGAGAADIPLALARWGRAAGFDLQVVALDLTRECLDRARRDTGRELHLVRGDALRLPLLKVDYVMSSMFFHHMTDEDCLRLLRSYDAVARRGIVVNDLLRRRRAWAWAIVTSGFYGRLARNDAPLSVLRAFTKKEARALAADAALPWLRVNEFFGHRFTLAGERP
ncbi:MAG: methyltransferase domain-containing protein [Planctomycetes bacterium]|nr:methyltransferase domain-containing protein [Planctomycetota bacterium]